MTNILNPKVSFTRPADTTAYAVGDLIANSVTAASVVVPTWPTTSQSGGFYLGGIRLLKSGNVLTNASFRIHMFSVVPTIATAGDNSVFSANVSGMANWIGSFDGQMLAAGADGAAVNCTPTEGLVNPIQQGQAQPVFALLQAILAYTPASGEIFTISPLIEQQF